MWFKSGTARPGFKVADNPENPLFFKKKRRVEALNSINVSGLVEVDLASWAFARETPA